MSGLKQIRLIGKRHKIVWKDEIIDDDGDAVLGMYTQRNKLIQIQTGQTHDDERETVLHEILHALEEQMNAEIPEAKLRQLAVGLYAALKDNPRLVDYLLEEESDGDAGTQSGGLGGEHHGSGGILRGDGPRNP